MRVSGEKVDWHGATENPQGFRGSFPGLRRSGANGRKYRIAREVGLPGAVRKRNTLQEGNPEVRNGKRQGNGTPETKQHETHAG